MKQIRVDQAMLHLNRSGGDRPSVVVETDAGDYVCHRADVIVGGKVVASVVQRDRGSVRLEVPDDVDMQVGFREGRGFRMLRVGS
jgi:hypothetical protein